MVLKRLENEAEYAGLFCNAKTIEAQIFNHKDQVEIKVECGEILKISNTLVHGLKALRKTCTLENLLLGVHASYYRRYGAQTYNDR